MGKIIHIIWFAVGNLHLVTFESGEDRMMSGAAIIARSTWKEIHR